MTLSKIDQLRVEYTWTRHIAKKPTVAVWEKLNDAVTRDLKATIKVRRALMRPKKDKQGELFA